MKALRLLQQPVFRVLTRPHAAAAANLVGTGARTARPRARWAHKTPKKADPEIPATTPFVPDVETFLTLIGRGLRQHTSKFPSWEALFTLTSDQLRELGLLEARTRKYLIRWRHRFKRGLFGAGGDLPHVENGRAELRVVERDVSPMVTKRWPVNVPAGKRPADVPLADHYRPPGYKAISRHVITGPYAMPLKKGGAVVAVTEGMWEDKRGHKVDGGERRRALVRHKRRIATRRARRERRASH